VLRSERIEGSSEAIPHRLSETYSPLSKVFSSPLGNQSTIDSQRIEGRKIVQGRTPRAIQKVWRKTPIDDMVRSYAETKRVLRDGLWRE
jgi:hypothetical protein